MNALAPDPEYNLLQRHLHVGVLDRVTRREKYNLHSHYYNSYFYILTITIYVFTFSLLQFMFLHSHYCNLCFYILTITLHVFTFSLLQFMFLHSHYYNSCFYILTITIHVFTFSLLQFMFFLKFKHFLRDIRAYSHQAITTMKAKNFQ